MASQTLQIVVTKTPTAFVSPTEHFALQTLPALEPSALQQGQVLVETLYLSFDPVIKTWLHPGSANFVKPGDKMAGVALVRVLASQDTNLQPGDIGTAWSGWTTHAVLAGKDFTKIEGVLEGTRPADYLGYLGLTGLTGYFGMIRAGKPQKGDTVVVNAAAGATGSIAAQTAKILGAGKVIGIAGGEDKLRWLKETAGLDETLNYRDADFREKFAKAVPDGIDVYFDNVGGDQLELGIDHLAKYGRIALCGNLSAYNDPNPRGITNLFQVAIRNATVQGVHIFDYLSDAEEGRKVMNTWVNEGKLKSADTIRNGSIEDAPQILVELFEGKNTGKMLLEIKNPDA